jgi:hypothetical protein
LLTVGAPEFRRVLDVNVVGTWLVSRACASRMVAAGEGGRICNVSSLAASAPAGGRRDRRRHLLALLAGRPRCDRRGVERERRADNGVAMPILDARHDLAHPVEGDSAWSESYYFNAYDPGTDSGLFTRIGIRPNEGTMDVGLSFWLPGGELGEYRWLKEQRAMVDTNLEVGAVRYAMVEPLSAWHLTMEGDVEARPCRRGATTTHTVPVALDVRFDALTPAVGSDGQAGRGPRSAEAQAAAGTVGKGHLEQAGRWSGTLTVDGVTQVWRGALGNRDRSWGPRRWGGPTMWRWFSINFPAAADADGRPGDLHFGGIRLGTEAGDLHRGWVWDGTRAASVAEWRVRTKLADDGVTHRVVHLDVVDKEGRTFPLRGDVLRVADVGRAGGTMVNEGLARWTCEDPDGGTRTGYGICEYLHQLDDGGRPVVAVD